MNISTRLRTLWDIDNTSDASDLITTALTNNTALATLDHQSVHDTHTTSPSSPSPASSSFCCHVTAGVDAHALTKLLNLACTSANLKAKLVHACILLLNVSNHFVLYLPFAQMPSTLSDERKFSKPCRVPEIRNVFSEYFLSQYLLLTKSWCGRSTIPFTLQTTFH